MSTLCHISYLIIWLCLQIIEHVTVFDAGRELPRAEQTSDEASHVSRLKRSIASDTSNFRTPQHSNQITMAFAWKASGLTYVYEAL